MRHTMRQGPIDLEHRCIYVHSGLCQMWKEMCIACDCRGNGVKNRSGIWGSSCGFQSDKIQKPMVLVCAPVLPAPLPRFNDWRSWGGGGVQGKNIESQGPESTLPHRISTAAGCNVARCSHTAAIRAFASTRSHCGLFYNLEPHVAFRNVVGNQALPRNSSALSLDKAFGSLQYYSVKTL